MDKSKRHIINMKALKVSREKIKAGDIFTFQMKAEPGVFRYGRVIRTDASIVSMDELILLYIYKASSEEKEKIPDLDRNSLLIPPTFINRLPWSSAGCFETITNRELEKKDVLETHCFLFDFFDKKEYFDEYGNTLSEPVEPVGVHALSSYRTIDYKISVALGIPPAPLD